MVVIGEGTQIPFTENYIYDIDKVIMVIEVKKNLYNSELSDGYANLRSVVSMQEPTRDLKLNPIEDVFCAICKKILPDLDKIKNLDIKEQMLYHSLVVEALLPLRVILGYSGFKDEKTLRNKFVEYLECNISKDNEYIKGYGATSLPNLIVAGECALVKTNGMPYGLTIDDVDEFCWIASYRKNPLVLFLELLWTRLTYFYDLPVNIFGDEIRQEVLIPLLTATGTKSGWIYNVISYFDENMKILDNDKKWMPAVLLETEFNLINILCNRGGVNIDQLEDNLEIGESVLLFLVWDMLQQMIMMED